MQFTIECLSCGSLFKDWTSPKLEKRYDANVRSVLACKEVGIGYSKLSNLFAIMNVIDPMHHSTYLEIAEEVHIASVEAAEECMNRAAVVIKEQCDSTSTSIPSRTVSQDGTWQKRGHSSHNGVSSAIDFETGLVLDFQVLSNWCQACTNGPSPGDPRYDEWYLNHKWKCQKNTEGSSNSMEAEAASLMWQRSVRKRGLEYGTMLCDGDSKAFQAASESCGYSQPIVKEDCINHIAKRMFNALDNLKKSNKAELNYKLTKPNIEKITNTYATNLKSNAPDPEEMKKGVLAGFFHMMSTDDSPNHKFCPEGESSWCHYKRSEATGEPQRPHKPTFSRKVGSVIFPTIKRLTDLDLLKRCAKMGTQNANESFNSLIWKRSPKNEFHSRSSVETSTSLATLSFNCGPFGLHSVYEKLDLPWEKSIHDYCLQQQFNKQSASRKRKLGVSKWKRKNAKKQRISLEHQRTTKEGPTYGYGAFDLQ